MSCLHYLLGFRIRKSSWKLRVAFFFNKTRPSQRFGKGNNQTPSPFALKDSSDYKCHVQLWSRFRLNFVIIDKIQSWAYLSIFKEHLNCSFYLASQCCIAIYRDILVRKLPLSFSTTMTRYQIRQYKIPKYLKSPQGNKIHFPNNSLTAVQRLLNNRSLSCCRSDKKEHGHQ